MTEVSSIPRSMCQQSVIFLMLLLSHVLSVEPLDQIPSAQNGPVVLSPVALNNLARAEMDIHGYMTELAEGLEKQLALVKGWVADYEESTVRAVDGKGLNRENDPSGRKRATLVANHPFLTYRMMRRFANRVGLIQEAAALDYEAKFSGKLKRLQSGRQWPGKQQLEDVIASIFRLQSMYNLPVKDMSVGNFGDVSTGVELSIGQSFEIAKFGLSYDYFTLAMDWFKVAGQKLQSGQEETKNSSNPDPQGRQWTLDEAPVNQEQIKSGLETLVHRHDQLYETYIQNSNYYVFREKFGVTEVSEPESLPVPPRFVSYNVTELDPKPGFEASHLNFMALCNGEDLLSDAEKSQLFCWLDHKSHPYWSIGPLKMEWLYFEPPVVQAYDFIGPEMMKKLRHLAVPLLDQPPPIQDEYTTPRSAMYAWMTDHEYPQIEPFIRNIEAATRLNAHGMRASTPLQVASYAFGGYVATHWDSFGEDTDDPKGDRLMTALFYLNEVKQGGLTAFPLLGISVKPVMGSGVFWYLARRDGTVDRRMLHGACPVILGEKWIATKWIHQNENFQKWPCALKSDKVTIKE